MADRRMYSSWLWALTLAVACSGNEGGEEASPDFEIPDFPEAEVVENASGRVDERSIRASLVNDDVEVYVPVERVGEGVVPAKIEVTLRDAASEDDASLGSDSVQVEQARAEQDHRLVIAGAGAGLDRVASAPIVIDWRVSLPDGALFGKRSLYQALGKFSVQLRGPTALPPAGTSPLRVIVSDPDGGEALADARVRGVLLAEQEDGKPSELFSGRTDAQGEYLAELALPPQVQAGRVRVVVRYGGSEVHSETEVEIRRDEKIYLSTDKTIYKPGQRVELRALALQAATKQPVADADVLFEAYDGKDNKVFKRRAATDEFGVAAISVPTDTRLNEGDWRFIAVIGEQRAQLTIPVTRYVLPKMQVEVSTEQPFALPGDTVQGSVQARYLFGEPVTGAAVELSARTRSGAQVTSLVGTTDDQGSYDFEVTIPETLAGPSLQRGEESLLLAAAITDTADQQQTGSGALTLAAAPVLVEMLSEYATVMPGVDNTVFLRVSDPLGRPLSADIEITGLGDEPMVMRSAQNGIAEFVFTPASGEAVSFQASATDGAERTHARSFSIPRSASPPALLVRTDKAFYEVGDTAHIRVLSAGDERRAYLDLYRGLEGLGAVAVDLEDGEGETTLEITESMRGLLVMDAFAASGAGQIVRATRRMLVEPDDGLRLELETGAETYLPGEEATVRLQVTDERGEPQVASVGLAVVNEASFELGGEPPYELRRFFSFDSRVLPEVAVMGFGPGDLLAADDPDARDQLGRMLFSRGGEVSLPRFDHNSYAEEAPQVRSRIEDVVRADGVRFVEQLERMVDDGMLNAEAALEVAAQLARRQVDPFGQLYRAQLAGTALALTSAGPDERIDTDDDASASVSLAALLPPEPSSGSASGSAPSGGFDGSGAGDFGGAAPEVPGANDAFDQGGAPPPDATADPDGRASGQPAGTLVRTDFREMVYVNPTLITDASGRASVSFPLAHSITTWRLSADASTRDGRLGSAKSNVRTLQSFFVDFDMPVTLTRGDVVELPAVVYNYLSEPASVQVGLDAAAWFELEGPAQQVVDLGPSEVRAVKFRVRVLEAGEQELTLRGDAGSASDALVRRVEVLPDGHPEDESVSGVLSEQQTHTLEVPADAVEGGTTLTLSLTPGFAAEAVQGIEGMLREPNGCFEQTTATAWPNTLVTQYLEDTGQLTDELREQSTDLVTKGYQRLLTFESPTGGYNWWGDATPGNRILTAIFLWHLKDLETLIETDQEAKRRALEWLLSQQNPDGSWDAGDQLHAGNESLGTSVVRTTAFMAWALSHTGWAEPAVERALGWLQDNQPDESDLYANALSANAFAVTRPSSAVTSLLMARLDEKKQASDGAVSWQSETPSWTGASGNVGTVETTGLVAYAMMNAGAYASSAQGAMRYLTEAKDGAGTWYNTQATMNALRAMSAAVEQSPRQGAEGTLTVRVNGVDAEVISLDPAQADVWRRFDLSEFVSAGANTVELVLSGSGEVSYQITRRAHRPAPPQPNGPLELAVDYDRVQTAVGAPVTVTAVARNHDAGTRDQVMVRVGRAPGFVPRHEDLRALVQSGLVARYELSADDVTFYLMGLESGESRELRFRLTPTLAADVMAPASSIYAYYEPDLEHVVDAQRFVVTAP